MEWMRMRRVQQVASEFSGGGSFRVAPLLAAGMLVCTAVYAGEDSRFDKQRLELGAELDHVLVVHGVCANVNECVNKRIIFASPATGGVGIQIWGLEDKEIIGKLLETCASVFLREIEIDVIAVNIYPISKEESMKKKESMRRPFWRSEKPIQRIVFTRKNYAKR
ncbi:MAG: hypothetical protein JO067_00560 [Cupriavidus sp.]|nr:hypothetical protein [Cupriavidus sp.]